MASHTKAIPLLIITVSSAPTINVITANIPRINTIYDITPIIASET